MLLNYLINMGIEGAPKIENTESHERTDFRNGLQMILIGQYAGMDEDSESKVLEWIEKYSKRFSEIFNEKYPDGSDFHDLDRKLQIGEVGDIIEDIKSLLYVEEGEEEIKKAA